MAINVLLIDDSAVMRAMILKSLEMSGVPLGEVFQAANGEEGLELLSAQPIDMVMLDISMPGMRGDEMLERMRSSPDIAEIPVLVISNSRIAEGAVRREAFVSV